MIPTELRLEYAPAYELEVRYPTGKQRLYAFADRPLAVYEEHGGAARDYPPQSPARPAKRLP